jgi:hypothetical protein
MQSLSDRAMLVDLTIRKWSASKQDKAAGNKIAQDQGADARMYRANKKLLSDEALAELNDLDGQIRRDHYELTLPWSDKGLRILASTGFLKYTQIMRANKDRWDAALDRFVYAYPTRYEEAKRLLNGGFNASEYPDPSRIGDKFAFGYNVVPVPSANDFRVNLGDVETARIRQNIEQQTQELLQKSVADVWARMQTVVSRMVERLNVYVPRDGESKAQNTFKDSLVDNVRDLLDLIPVLNITDDPSISMFAARMRDELTKHSADTLRISQDARESTAKAAEDILTQMEAYI